MLHQKIENPSDADDLGDVTAGDGVHVTVYTKHGCMPCRMTKRALERHAIPYVEVDVSANPEARERIRELGYSSVPVVVVGDGHWCGYSPERIERLARRAA